MNLISALLCTAALTVTGDEEFAPDVGEQMVTPAPAAVQLPAGGGVDDTVMELVALSSTPFVSFACTVTRWLPSAVDSGTFTFPPFTVVCNVPSRYTCVNLIA